MKQQCPCSDLDWRDLDQTAGHHPECLANDKIEIHDAITMPSYTDMVKDEKPLGYWPMDDVPISGTVDYASIVLIGEPVTSRWVEFETVTPEGGCVKVCNTHKLYFRGHVADAPKRCPYCFEGIPEPGVIPFDSKLKKIEILRRRATAKHQKAIQALQEAEYAARREDEKLWMEYNQRCEELGYCGHCQRHKDYCICIITAAYGASE